MHDQTPNLITFLCRSLDYGGAERQLLLLAEGLIQKGTPTEIITFYPSKLTSSLVPIHCLHKKSRWDVVGFLRRLIQALRHKPIVHSYLTFPNVLAAIWKIFSPRTKVIWGMRASNMQWQYYDGLARILAQLERRLSRRVDGIIVNSWAGRQFLENQGYDSRYMTVIPNGVDVKRFRPQPKLKKNEIRIGMVARLDPMKDYPTFLHAAKIVAKTYPQAQFICVGDGDTATLKTLKDLALSLGLTIEWRPAFSAIETFYPTLTLLCSSSAYGEGLSNVLLEALACGIPCVATDVGDARHVVGEYGLIVSPGDSEALAAAVIQILQKDVIPWSESSSFIEQNYDRDQLIEKTRAFIFSFETRPRQ